MKMCFQISFSHKKELIYDLLRTVFPKCLGIYVGNVWRTFGDTSWIEREAGLSCWGDDGEMYGVTSGR